MAYTATTDAAVHHGKGPQHLCVAAPMMPEPKDDGRVNMTEYEGYAKDLEELALREPLVASDPAVDLALNGQAASELRRRVPLEKRRESGAFFSPPEIVRSVTSRLASDLDSTSVVFDPACGAGNLLLGAARQLASSAACSEPAEFPDWSRQLLGLDLHGEFVRAARARLILLARVLAEGRAIDTDRVARSLEGIRIGSGLGERESLSSASHIVMNPPFSMVSAPPWVDWASGQVNQAALFVWTAAAEMGQDSRLIAVVPDVLRSGSRYSQFRSRLRDLGELTFPERHAKFDRYTDVHTALLEFRWKENPDSSHEKTQPSIRIGDYFKVHVGPVVPFRLTNKGPWRPYLLAQNCPRWGEVGQRSTSIRFDGTTFEPPFVVVRRTSRPEDPFRAVPTLVTLSGEVAIENHLLVLVPRDGEISTCQRLLKVLREPKTSEWLNHRIRCRHLTVGALKDLPWGQE